MVLVETLILVSVLALCFYKWATANYDFFKKRNIPYIKPIPLFGSFTGFLFKTESMHEETIRRHNEFKSSKVYGIFEMRQPAFVINDLELLKQITVKDFDHFVNHRHFVDPEIDPLFGQSLLNLTDQKWKDMRSTLSPAFTGSKMRLMFQLITEVCDDAVKHIKNLEKAQPNGIDIEMKEFFTLFSNDAIGSTAFGLKVNSLANKDNEFYKMALRSFQFSALDIMKFIFYQTFTSAFKFFGVKLLNKEFTNYFYRLVMDTIKYRTENNITRPDMINILMEAKKSPEKSHDREWTDLELAAQCFIFHFAGFESVSTTLCFATQELVENLDVQEKLIAEIDEANSDLDGKSLTYEILHNMKYMDMVVSEVLRKWPPFIQGNRICNKPCTLNSGDLHIEIKEGDYIWIPILGLHYDPEYFPNPKKFDPERFSEENKGNIKPFSYAPFGLGPRVCIASRLALMEIKSILFNILTNFTLEANSKTTIPIKLASTNFPVASMNDFWLKMIPRK